MNAGEILLVDDESSILDICGRTLTRMGFNVRTAGDGSAALKVLRSKEADLVVTDLAMPGPVDGKKLTEEIKRNWPSTDVIIMTAHPALETAIPTLKEGAYEYLTKPFNQELLETVVSRCFEKRRLSKELNREKMLRRELEAAYLELQKVERLKEAILSRLSHELRTPICSSLMALESLDASPQDSKLREMMKSSLGRLQGTVEELLLFARLSNAEKPVQRKPVNLRKLVDGIVENYRFAWENRGIKLEIQWEDGAETIEADFEDMSAAMKHLLLNAINFNRPGGNIIIRATRCAEDICVSFSDTGIGIPKDKLPRIFDGFYQAAEYLTRTVGGVGLGLAIVRRIAAMHGGSVSVESEEGRGSAFTMRLPEEAVAVGNP